MIEFTKLYETPISVVTFYRYTYSETCCYTIEYDDLTENCELTRSNHLGFSIFSKYRNWLGVVPIDYDEVMLSWELAVNVVAFDII